MHDKKRTLLANARTTLGLSLRDAGALTGASYQTVANWEHGGGRGWATSLAGMRSLCRAYMTLAEDKGYDPAEFHESVLCPGEFPAPAPVKSEVPA
jgi:hypothetical protein